METKGITISAKNLTVWVMIVGLVIAQITTYTLLKDQVRRNTKELEQYDLAVITVELKHITDEVAKINSKTDKIFTLVQDYFKNGE